jgi:DNA transformation protein and related proteins
MKSGISGEQFAAYVVDLLAPLAELQMTRFFGGFALKSGAVQFAMIIKGRLYLRVDASLAASLAAAGSKPFTYATRRGTVTVGKYYDVSDDWLEDSNALTKWARHSIAAAGADSGEGRAAGRRRKLPANTRVR